MHQQSNPHSRQRIFLWLLICFFLGTGFITGQESLTSDTKQPNVVFILADDLGWRDLSNEGSTFYESPNIDRIANQGMKFTRGYAACQVCSPSRAAIMSGKAPARIKITDWIGAAGGKQWNRNTRLLPAQYERQLAHEEVSLAEAFQEAGYTTFFAGKWHLGGKGSFPEDHGFDVNIGGHHRGSPPGGYFSPYNNPKMDDGSQGEQLPLRLGRETADFIRQHRDQPFFAFLSFYSVHGPIQSTQALWKKYREKAIKLEKPDHRFIIDRTSPVRQVQDHPLYAGMVESMDDAVGMVLDTLDELELTDSTIVIFTSWHKARLLASCRKARSPMMSNSGASGCPNFSPKAVAMVPSMPFRPRLTNTVRSDVERPPKASRSRMGILLATWMTDPFCWFRTHAAAMDPSQNNSFSISSMTPSQVVSNSSHWSNHVGFACI